MRFSSFCLSVSLVITGGENCLAAPVEFKVNTVYEDASGDISSGSGSRFFMDRTGPDGDQELRRTLVAFDLTSLARNALINSGEVSFAIDQVPLDASTDVASLHAMTRDWGEGASDALGNEVPGTAAQPDDATWTHTFFDTGFWSIHGGGFKPVASASTLSGTSNHESMTFETTPELVADVQGWILRGDENTRQNARRMASREHTTDPVPVLTIEFSIPTVVDHLGVSQLTASLTNPVAIANAGDGSDRLFIVEQEGIIRIYDLVSGNLLASPFLDIRGDVFSFEDSGGHNEQGLLGLAFHPDYPNNGIFYVNYTISPSPNEWHTVVVELEVSGDPDIAQANGTVILQFQQEKRNHNGGDLHFGKDGYLYIASGDGGGGDDQYDNAQNIDTLKGAMLRIDVNGTPPVNGELCSAVQLYDIPPDNPFTGSNDGCDEIFHFGLRNPWRFSFDAISSDMYIADVGQNIWEEINFVPDGSAGVNYGWSCREGMHDFLDGNACISAFTDPVLEYSHGDVRCSVTGGYLYRGSSLGIYGHYIYGDYCTGQIWLARQQDGVWTSQEWINGNPMEFGLSAFGQDENCELYMVNRSTRTLYRFTDSEFLFRGGFESPGCQ